MRLKKKLQLNYEIFSKDLWPSKMHDYWHLLVKRSTLVPYYFQNHVSKEEKSYQQNRVQSWHGIPMSFIVENAKSGLSNFIIETTVIQTYFSHFSTWPFVLIQEIPLESSVCPFATSIRIISLSSLVMSLVYHFHQINTLNI